MTFGKSFDLNRRNKVKCKTFTSDTPPEFLEDKARFNDLKSGATIEVDRKRLSGFRRSQNGSQEVFKIKICKKNE